MVVVAVVVVVVVGGTDLSEWLITETGEAGASELRLCVGIAVAASRERRIPVTRLGIGHTTILLILLILLLVLHHAPGNATPLVE